MMRRNVLVGAIVAAFVAACSRTTEVPRGAELSLLQGRCVQLLQSADVLRVSGPNVIDGSLYVPSSTVNESKIATIPAGSRIIIQHVVLLRSFGARHSIVIGKADNSVDRVSVFMLFDGDWLRRAELDAFENRHAAMMRQGALREEVARWCTP